MHPALSVIFFTVLSGFGYGLFAALAIVGILHPGLDTRIGVAGSAVGLVLVTGGLLSSTLHLANPKNAWRAFSRFRTSWLSREGVLALLFYPPAALYLACWWSATRDGWSWLALSLLILFLALAVVFSTGMIYGCLKTIRQWCTPLTPVNYVLLAAASGFLLFLLLHQLYAGAPPSGFLAAGVFLVALAGVMKVVYYRSVVGAGRGPTAGAALGLPRAEVRLLDVGHTAGTFLTDEFGYRVAAGRLARLRVLSLVLAFAAPLLLLAALMFGRLGVAGVVAALLSAAAGIFIERWLFFADARHVVNLYHGAQQT